MIPHLVVAVLYALLGWGLCVRWRLPCRGLEGLAWAYGLGTGVASLGLMALVALGAWRPISATPALGVLVPLLGVVLVGYGALRFAPRGRLPTTGRLDLRSKLALTAIFALLWLTLFVPAIDTGFDALAYHLPAVRRLATDGLGPTVGLLDGEMRLGFDLLFLPGFDLADPTRSGPAAIHLVAALALAAGVAAEAARRTSLVVGAGVGLLFALTPGMTSIAPHAYVDAGVGLYVFLSLAAASRALREGDRACAIAAGLFAGFAANAKLPAGAAIVAVGIALLVGRGGARGARNAALATGVAALVALPWIVRAFANTGNPFFPVLVERFGSGWADAEAVVAAKRAALDQLPVPRDVLYGTRAVVHGAFSPAGGFEAPAWVLAFLPAAFLRPVPPARRGLLAGLAVLVVAWVAFVPLFRFGIGLWAWGAVAAAFGAHRLARVGRPAAIALAILLVALLAAGGYGVAKSIRAADRATADGAAPGRFGPAIAFLGSPTRTLYGPVGLSSSLVAFGPPGTIALEPARNGLLRAEDFDEPARLRAACRRIGLRSLLLDETTVEGRKAIECARVWAKDPAVRVVFPDGDVPGDAARPGHIVTVTFPKDEAK